MPRRRRRSRRPPRWRYREIQGDTWRYREIHNFLRSSHFQYIRELKAKEGHIPKLDDFKVIRVMGEGGFGQVIDVVKRDCGVHYAMKVMHKEIWGDMERYRGDMGRYRADIGRPPRRGGALGRSSRRAAPG